MSRNPIPPRVPPKAVVASKPVPPRPVTAPAPIAPETPVDIATPVPATASPASDFTDAQVVVARAASYYRMTRYTMVFVLLGMGGWFGYDGFKGWPDENLRIADVNRQFDAAMKTTNFQLQDKLKADPLRVKPLRSHTDIFFQKLLGFALPCVGVAMLAWALRRSRGEYRLAGTTLTVPGHPPIQLQDVFNIDKQLWDRKGIAYLDYNRAGRKGRIVLDDFIYDRDPTDEIYKRVDQYVAGAAG